MFIAFIRAFHFDRSNLPLVRFSSSPSVIATMIRMCCCLAAVMRLTMSVGNEVLSMLELNGAGPHSSSVVLAHRLYGP